MASSGQPVRAWNPGPSAARRSPTPYDVAPTLANYLGVKPPSGSIGNPLEEIVGD